VLDQLARPIQLGTSVGSVTGSIGIAVLDGTADELSETALLHQADLAMYSAKHSGKGVARSYTAELVTPNGDLVALREALLADIEDGAIDIALQPIYHAAGELYAVEALARWSYRGALVPPATFLPIAREFDCVAAIDEIVLRKGVARVAPFIEVILTVNVDGRTLTRTGYARHVASVLSDYDLVPSRLAVEVVELGLIEQDPTALETLRELRELGVRVVVDDFGAGYSTLARLRALRPDVLKIDRSLVVGTDTDEHAALLLDSVVRLGQLIGAQVVAEGIETEAELRAALGAGCDAVQGFFLGRPVRVEELGDVLTQRPSIGQRPVGGAEPELSYGRIAR
jgi:EAL domain-containing protein (putative c-di-GMP-specific phosphodiesterase class I)